MTRFKFCLTGTAQSPILELDAASIPELHRWLANVRYVEGRMVEIDGEATNCQVLLPVSRIQMIFEIAGD